MLRELLPALYFVYIKDFWGSGGCGCGWGGNLCCNANATQNTTTLALP